MIPSEPSPTRPAAGYLERLSIPVCLSYLFLLVTLFGPFALWTSNRAELASSFLDLAPSLLWWKPGLLLLGAGLVAFFLPVRLTRTLAVLVFSAILFAIVEFNFFRGESELVGNIGDGIQVDTTGTLTRVLVLAAILGVVLLMRKGIHRVAISILACMALVGFAQIAMTSLSSPEPPSKSDQENGAPAGYSDFFTFSKDNNIIHIIMDELQYSFFEMLARREFPDYESTLDGFVFYRNHLGLYPNTHHSMFSMFQNTVFYNKSPTREWMAKIGEYSIFDDLVSAGVEVNIMSALNLSELAGKTGIDRNVIPVPYVDFSTISGGEWSIGSVALEAELLRDLTIKRLIPDPLQADAGPAGPGPDADARDNAADRAPAAKVGTVAFTMEKQLSNAEILRDWGTHSRVGTTGTVYRQLHTLVTHNPAVLKADCTLREKPLTPNWANMYPQTTCAVGRLFRFFERLKEIGAYDDSTIIVHADHGKRHAWQADSHLEEFVFGAVQDPPVFDFGFSRVVSSAMPILLVKKRNARHPLRVSNAPTSFSDIAPTIRHLAGASLAPQERTIFDIEEEEERVRSFFYYHYPNRTDPYLDRLIEYRVEGPVWQPASWSQAAVYLGPHSDFRSDRIDMGASEYRHHERDWWLQGTDSQDKTRTIAYTIGPFSEIQVEFADRADRTMTLFMKSMVRDQVVDVALNGRSLGAIVLEPEIGRYSEYKIDLPSEYLKRAASELNVILFRPRRLRAGWQADDQRIPYGVGIDWIEFEAR